MLGFTKPVRSPQVKETTIKISQLCDAAIEAQLVFLKEEHAQQRKVVTAAAGISGRVYENELELEAAIEADISFFQTELTKRNRQKKSAA